MKSRNTRKNRSDWHPEDIKAQVRKSGTTLTALSRKAGLSESACRKSLKVAFPAADRLISEQLNVPLHKIWPSRYDQDGRRLRTIHKRENNSGKREAPQRLSAGAF